MLSWPVVVAVNLKAALALTDHRCFVLPFDAMATRKRQISPLALRSWTEKPLLHPCVNCREQRCAGPEQKCEVCKTRIADAARIIRLRFVH